jgi:RNA polymerase sigma factor (sigma-70 family)
MEQISREKCKDLISKHLEGDSEAFDIIYEQFHRIVHLHTKKWFASITKASLGLYDYEDIYQHLWMGVLEYLPKYDPERANPITWLYLRLGTVAGMLYRNQGLSIRHPQEDQSLVHLEHVISNADGETMQLLDLIIDPRGAFESEFIDEEQAFMYVYMLSELISKMSYKHKLVYLHYIKGMGQLESSNILGLSQSYICRMRNNIIEKAKKLLMKMSNSPIDSSVVNNLSMALLSLKSDDELHEELELDLGVIKICREVLSLANLY